MKIFYVRQGDGLAKNTSTFLARTNEPIKLQKSFACNRRYWGKHWDDPKQFRHVKGGNANHYLGGSPVRPNIIDDDITYD